MKTFLRTFLFFAFFFCRLANGISQILPPGQVAKFGIDGDIRSDERQNGTFAAAGSHDWFKKEGGTGLGLIDTTGGASLRGQIVAGSNIAFSRRMQFMRYSVHDGVVMMDACYARDFLSNDKTMFSGNGTKNTASPYDWGTAPNGGQVSDKTDIIDSYVSMRRNGTEVIGSNVGSLIATMGLSTLSTNGDRYADFEFYKERIDYNTTTGKFANAGPVAYGGHSLWEFNTDGSIRAWGDMTISFTFNSSSVSDIKILIWVMQSTAQLIKPKGFDFTGEFYASTSASGYGYAVIKQKTTTLAALGSVNTAISGGPLWGTNSKDLGSNGNNYFSDRYAVGQFAEAAVDLTELGVDPATFMNMSACNPPFTRFLTKSRSSSSFSSALSDFNGPFEFLDVPTIPASIAQPAPLTCVVGSVTLSPSNYFNGAFYSWRTENGAITGSNSDSSAVTVAKPGTYYLTAAITKGCVVNVDSVVVSEDKNKPVATASVSDMVFPGTKVTLYGGDTAASNYPTPFGRSQGLLWHWKGPLGFTSTEQNPLTGNPGEYTLVVTERRNGCSDTALTYVIPYPSLPVVFRTFAIDAGRQKGFCQLTWSVADAAGVKSFTVERTTASGTFVPAATVPAAITGSFSEAVPPVGTLYRIRAENKEGKLVYSPVVKVTATVALQNLLVAFSDGKKNLFIRFTATRDEVLSVIVNNASGQVLWKGRVHFPAGTQLFKVPLPTHLQAGIHFIQAQGTKGTLSATATL